MNSNKYIDKHGSEFVAEFNGPLDITVKRILPDGRGITVGYVEIASGSKYIAQWIPERRRKMLPESSHNTMQAAVKAVIKRCPV